LLNLVVLDAFWITLANSTRDSQRNSGTGIQDTQSRCKEEQLLWSKSLSPSSFSFPALLPRHRHRPTSQLLFHYPSASLDYTQFEKPNEPDSSSWSFSYGRALWNLSAPGGIRNTVAIILPFDLTSCTPLESTSNRYDPPPSSYATRIRTTLSTT